MILDITIISYNREPTDKEIGWVEQIFQESKCPNESLHSTFKENFDRLVEFTDTDYTVCLNFKDVEPSDMHCTIYTSVEV